ncbi:PD-(D/E)XK motif protein [Nocardia vinacea]|uniref:PD-(D/E)XK motif protein n=1 Tax=Nocardia vinacea TaxID=96468 RepID=A0ABZ1Z6A4_9NOCA|nr:PD-(D/E)XK motif protein [Nocardia vinacea]
MTEAIINDARHYSLANVDAFWDAGNPVVLPIAGTPECILDIDPANETIALITPFTPPEPDVAKWRNITLKVSDGEDLAELTVAVEDNLHGAYGLLTSTADQLQLEKAPLAVAVATAITKHRNMFASKAGLSQDREIGLYGELLVLDYLIGKVGTGPVIASWQGPFSEEHDFVFGEIHLEIKTTSAEQRRHTMHGFTQLVPLCEVPLSLISIQLTRSNHEGGQTLSQMVSQLRAKSGGHRSKVDAALEACGWRDEDASLYTTFWTKRNEPRAYNVDDHFPALTLDRLVQVIANMTAVSDLSYRVDVTHFAHQTLPGPLAGLVEVPEETA